MNARTILTKARAYSCEHTLLPYTHTYTVYMFINSVHTDHDHESFSYCIEVGEGGVGKDQGEGDI